MELTDPIVNDLNTIADWLSIDNFSNQNILTPDLLIIVGHAIIPNIIAAINFAVKSELPILFSGGVGHSTPLLKQAVNEYLFANKQPVNSNNKLSEASLYLEMASTLFDISKNKIYLEDKSTNCGLNASLSLDLIIKENLKSQHIVLVQDPLMQRRTFESFKYFSQQKNVSPHFINWPVFKPKIKRINKKYIITGEQTPSIWDIERYISVILGEVKRLRDDTNGYGPTGLGFIGHVDIPDSVEKAWQRLAYDFNLLSFIR